MCLNNTILPGSEMRKALTLLFLICLISFGALRFAFAQADDASYNVEVEAITLSQAEKLAKAGNVDLQYALGMMYFHGNKDLKVKQNYKEAFKWLKLAADNGIAKAQSIVGGMYFEGVGAKKDQKIAFEYFKAAAEQNEDMAQLNLAGMYLFGDVVEQDVEIAISWYAKSAANGNKMAAEFLKDLSDKLNK